MTLVPGPYHTVAMYGFAEVLENPWHKHSSVLFVSVPPAVVFDKSHPLALEKCEEDCRSVDGRAKIGSVASGDHYPFDFDHALEHYCRTSDDCRIFGVIRDCPL